jgi:uncharacterized paraquat-inducible protein A
MGDDSLQFDRAEYERPAGAAACAQCQQQLTGSYYQINGAAVCPTCAETLRAQWTGGSGAGRLLRATLAGVAAAFLGALLYYGVSALTGYEFGLIAIVVGFAVGAAVRWGSNGRGGWKYQTLAIALTYLAIVSTYVPALVAGIRNSQAEAVSTSNQAKPGQTLVSQTDTNAQRPPTLRDFILAILILVAIACAAPFLAGIENILGLIIIAIGLYEAWKLNRRTVFEITGPHTVGTATVA